MRSATVICACLAIAMPLVSATIDFSVWPWALTSASTTAGTSSLAITGLTAGQAALGGIGGLLLAVKAGALLGLAARQLTGRNRGKRSTITDEQIGEQFVFDSIAAMDTADCGKKYLCEIAATPIQQLTQEELTSLLLFQTGQVASNGKAAFNEAVRLGAFSRNVKTCAVRYQRCTARPETFTNNV